MNRISRKEWCLVVFVLILIPISRNAWACEVDYFFLTKTGSLAATTNETLAQAAKFAETGRLGKLAELE